MSKDKYPSIFSPLMEAIVFIILQIFYATRAVLKIGEYLRIFPSFSWGIFSRHLFSYGGLIKGPLRWLKTVFCFFRLIELGAISKACNCSVLNGCSIFLR